MKTDEQALVRVEILHNGYPSSHEPLHSAKERECAGCDEFRFRRNRNNRAGKTIGVRVRGDEPDEPSGQCKGCKAPCYAALVGSVAGWAWNFDVDRAQWAIEDRLGKTHPRSLCPRCRASEKAA